MPSILRLARRLRSEDRGIALPVVFGLGIAMLIAVAGSMSVVTGGLLKTNTDEDTTGAMTAAYAGVQDYQSRLSNNATYWRSGNPASAYTIATASQSTVVMDAANKALGIGTTGTWATVPGGSTSTPSYFRYEVDNSDYQTKGILHLRSTGRVGTVTRSVVADLKQSGFIDYLYFTDYETSAPAYNGGYQSDGTTGVCEVHFWETPTRNSGCTNIAFGSSDTLTGPVHSNDTMYISGATFLSPSGSAGSITTAAPTSQLYRGSGPANNPTITHVSSVTIPPTNDQMQNEVFTDTPTTVPRPGCLYTGPTVITFLYVNGVAKMNVISPWTKYTETTQAKTSGSNPAQCGIPGTGAGQLGSSTGATVDPLNLNLVYVQNVPASSSDVNYTASGSYPTNFSAVSATSSTPAGWKLAGTSTTTQKVCVSYKPNGSCRTYQSVSIPSVAAAFPMAGEVTPSSGSSPTSYGPRDGDLFVSGVLGGQTTLAAQNNVWVTGDLVYNDATSDMLGLVGGAGVYVYNPLDTSNKSLLGDNGREIDAAILAVKSTFQVQNYDRGSQRGTLTVEGAIAQKFRGIVALQGQSGYAKDYQYDARFVTTAPPKFLTPVSTTYGVTQYAEVPAGYTSTGAPGTTQ